jgi:Transposase domain (DUF772)
MAYNFLRGDHDQPFLLPPDLRDWLPEGQLAWFVLDVVDQLDLQPFLRAYRADGHGHPAYDPKTLLGVLLYAYAIGVRSSRQIQRRCIKDLAFRVLAGNRRIPQRPRPGVHPAWADSGADQARVRLAALASLSAGAGWPSRHPASSCVALVLAGSVRHRKPLVLGGHKRSRSASQNRRSYSIHRSDLGRPSSMGPSSNPTSGTSLSRY